MSSSTSSSSECPKEENTDAPFEVQKRDILRSSNTRYLLLDFNGEGCFGKVAKCLDLTTGKLAAVKIHKKSQDHVIQREVDMLQAVGTLDPDKKNIVKFLDNFRFNNVSCLAFEMLDKSLWHLMKERRWVPLNLNEIRPVIQQLMVAFDALKSIGILHTDLKPDNIMLVNHKDQPFRIKLIDFGLALPVSKVRVGMTMQACAYRAPEVTLGLPLSEAIDVWGVGCVMAFLYFGINLLPGNCMYNCVTSMVHLLGQPDDHLLSAGTQTFKYFSMKENQSGPGWRLKTPEEYKEVTGVNPKITQTFFDLAKNLNYAVRRCPTKSDITEYKDRMAFLRLLKSCLRLDAGRRITPREALKHPFITMVHLVDMINVSSHADKAHQLMSVSACDHLDEFHDSFNDTHMDSSETSDTDSSYEVSDPQAPEADFMEEPSPASLSGPPENSSAEGADVENSDHSDTENFSNQDKDTEGSSDIDDREKSSNIASSTDESSHTDSCSAYSADIESSTDDDIQPARTRHIRRSTDEDDAEPASSYSSGGASCSLSSSSEEERTKPTEPSFHSDEACADDKHTAESSTGELSEGQILILELSPSSGSSRCSDCHNEVRELAGLSKESGAAPSSATINTVTDCGQISDKDRVSAAAGSTNGAAANIQPADTERKTLVRRIRKFFSRLKARTLSIFKPQRNGATYS
ncbi:Homeodomain-interacting protein kinase 2 [Nibea albiflora]|uniref:Homeodomain-interacting protein kinase 2 n=1 Tax=Nibea albiflora TaxID=240163 RepID=A0ACB7FA26_NIBAL|nr:Homeodomain-interacting protein kinase 2 [Nibea albiflora]